MLLRRMIRRKDLHGCVFCGNAPCNSVCPKHISPSKLLMSVWMDNEAVAAASLPEGNPCAGCDAPCERACVKAGEVPVRRLVSTLAEEVRPCLDAALPEDGAALETDICGVRLENPFLLSSSVVASTYEMCARAFEAGWAGAAFKTICDFDIHEASPRYSALKGEGGAIIGFKNIEQLSDHSVPENMATFRKLKKEYPNKVIVASMMGRDDKEWENLARQCQENGADVIELNFSCPNMMEEGLGSDIGQHPELVERFTAAARRGATIPILAKLTPNVMTMNPAAEAAKRGGADGVAAINTIKSVLNINPHTYVSEPQVRGKSAVGGYSGNVVRPIALRFIAEMGKNPALSGMHISGMGGVETWRDALEFLLLGADSVQVTTAVMQYGYRIIDDLKSGLNYYLREKGIRSVKMIDGAALDALDETTDGLERDTVVYPKFIREACVGCGRCEISCADGGHQAIHLNEKRRPVLDPKRCVGCHLCVLVCPMEAILSSGKRVAKTKNV
ncbi:MAG: NAD-dependent dihydropyrimidine dehydrogenase subunit PreA [Schwartzia sp.]|nr:NAD-dependent dihydropyrimidine dehydrogenase subunit PreA [Schwartzia sp. (in: firmicutes)]